MNALRTRIQRACHPTFQRLGAVLAFALTLTFILGVAPSHAAPSPQYTQPGRGDPVARIQVILRDMYIYNDRDTVGNGDLSLYTTLHNCTGRGASCLPFKNSGYMYMHELKYSAGTGSTVKIDRVLPYSGDLHWGDSPYDEALGFDFYKDDEYVIRLRVWDDDLSGQDFLGHLDIRMSAANNWHLGEYFEDATQDDGSGRGDFAVRYEVIRTQLADLIPSALERTEAAGATDLLCTTVKNDGWDVSGAFSVKFYLPGGSKPEFVQTQGENLNPGEQRQICASVALPTTGTSQPMSVSVDEDRRVPEIFEDNNLVRSSFTPTGPVLNPSPTQVAGKADLTVSTVKVNGQVPDGKDDCKDGKNTVAVLVKNAGSANAGDVQLRLVVDGAEAGASVQAVKALDAGEEREVKFGGVRLKQGPHTLVATVDADKAVTEANAANNTLTVTAGCSDGD